MLTSRGWWFLTAVVALLTVAIFGELAALAVLALTLLTWFLWALLRFQLALRWQQDRLTVQRHIFDERGPVESLWAERTFTVQVRVSIQPPLASTHVRLADRVPYSVERVAGPFATDGQLQPGQPLEIDYDIHCPAAGQVRFEGVQVQCSDLQGFFYQRRFLRQPRIYRVLPAYLDVKGTMTTVKRHNLLPLLGSHRHRRPGSGSELLDLRDYLPGDPPRTIAWKVSARRDRLITKEFETEVPLRCTFFVDTSHSVRVGRSGSNALARLIEITAALAQATARTRDLPGLCLFDDTQVSKLLRPARGRRHQIQLLHQLAEAAALAPAAAEVDVAELLPVAYAFASEVYPDLLESDSNTFPWWLPLRSPQVLPLRKRLLTLRGRSFWRKLWWIVSLRWHWPWLEVKHALLGRLLPRHWRQYRWRKKLAALLALQHGLGPGGLALLLEDDAAFSRHAQRFLAEHQVPFALPLYDDRGQYLFAAAGKVNVLATALLHAIRRGKDNELLVLLVDLLELDDQLEPLLKAVQVGKARHHQILVVCPWPPGLPPPLRSGLDTISIPKDAPHPHPLAPEYRGEGLSGSPRPGTPGRGVGGEGFSQNSSESTLLAELLKSTSLTQALQHITRQRLQRAFTKLRRAFGRIGVPVLCAAEADSVKLILERLEQLRLQGRGTR